MAKTIEHEIRDLVQDLRDSADTIDTNTSATDRTVATSDDSAAGDTTLVSGTAGQKIRVYSINVFLFANAAAASIVALKDGATVIFELQQATGTENAFHRNFGKNPWVLADGAALVFNKNNVPQAVRVTAVYTKS